MELCQSFVTSPIDYMTSKCACPLCVLGNSFTKFELSYLPLRVVETGQIDDERSAMVTGSPMGRLHRWHCTTALFRASLRSILLLFWSSSRETKQQAKHPELMDSWLIGVACFHHHREHKTRSPCCFSNARHTVSLLTLVFAFRGKNPTQFLNHKKLCSASGRAFHDFFRIWSRYRNATITSPPIGAPEVVISMTSNTYDFLNRRNFTLMLTNVRKRIQNKYYCKPSDKV